jgi:hypothetical protein
MFAKVQTSLKNIYSNRNDFNNQKVENIRLAESDAEPQMLTVIVFFQVEL